MNSCTCGRPNHGGRCTHCDHPCRYEANCGTCAITTQDMAADNACFDMRPHPTDAEIHDVPGALPVGAVGRCDSCGGRTYQLADGPWCPRAFCATDAPQDA